MKAPDTKLLDDGGSADEDFAKKKDPSKTLADFPINDKLLLDEIAKEPQNGYVHIQLDSDESAQHTESRNDKKETEEVLLDEIVKKAPVDYPDIE